jgi:predicted metal-binding membrane protein
LPNSLRAFIVVAWASSLTLATRGRYPHMLRRVS